MYVDDPASMHVNEVENFMRHGVEARPWLDVVVVMMGDEDARGVHGKRPETVEVDLLAHLQGGGHQHQAAAEPFGPDALHGPETLHVEQILWVEEEHASLGVKVVQHVLDSEGYVGVAGVVERWKHHRGVFVILENFIKWPPPFLQLLKSAQEERRETVKTQKSRRLKTQTGWRFTVPLCNYARIYCHQICFSANIS